jgi:hypothetical protein
MSLLDTYVKLQGLRQQQEAQQLQQVHSVLYLADAAQKIRAMQQEEQANQALANVSPDVVTERPSQGIVGMDEGYDVPDPTQMITERTPKPDEQYYGEAFEAVKPISMKHALPFLMAKRGAVKERETEERKRSENPLVPFEINGTKGTAALSNVTPLMINKANLEEKALQREQTAYDREQQREVQKQIAADNIATKRLIAEVARGNQSPYDKQIVTKTLTELPKLKKAAIEGQNTLKQTKRALELIEKGVTGKGGQLKAFLAPYAEMIGMPNDNLNDAQAFQLFARAIIGPMRLEMIGPGPVSEWEQQLMQKLSGGGGAAKPAAKELIGYYRQLAQGKVDNYNQTLEGITQIAPVIGKVYQPFKTETVGASQPVQQPNSTGITPEEARAELRRRGKIK